MKEIPLTQGLIAIVDDADYSELTKHKWYAKKSRNTFYACRSVHTTDGKVKSVKMHRQILGIEDSQIHCDHKNGDGLDNQRQNLRQCSIGENRLNSPARGGSKTGIKGVREINGGARFQARIGHNGILKTVGTFSTLREAAVAYNDAAKTLHGEFSRLNKEN